MMGVFDEIGAERSESATAGRAGESRTAENTAYACGCYLAVEHLVERLQRGQALLAAKPSPRAVSRWLRLAFRTTALIARMAYVAPSVEATFTASPVAQAFAAMAWPDPPADVDLDSFAVPPARWMEVA